MIIFVFTFHPSSDERKYYSCAGCRMRDSHYNVVVGDDYYYSNDNYDNDGGVVNLITKSNAKANYFVWIIVVNLNVLCSSIFVTRRRRRWRFVKPIANTTTTTTKKKNKQYRKRQVVVVVSFLFNLLLGLLVVCQLYSFLCPVLLIL